MRARTARRMGKTYFFFCRWREAHKALTKIYFYAKKHGHPEIVEMCDDYQAELDRRGLRELPEGVIDES